MADLPPQANASPAAAARRGPLVEVLTLVLMLAKAIAWPAALLYVFVTLKDPVFELLSRVPDVISGSTKITYGTFSMEVARTARESGSPELSSLLAGLSSRSFSALLELDPTKGRTYVWKSTTLEDGKEVAVRVGAPAGDDLKALNELEAKGLLVFEGDRGAFEHLLREKLKQVRLDDSGALFEWKQPPSLDDVRKIEAQSYKLSPRGTRARELAFKAMTKMLGIPVETDAFKRNK